MSPLTVGERLGRYQLDEDLGYGALGPVFCGTDSRNERKVLVRSVGPGLIEDRGLWRKLREAAQRVRRLDHPVPAQVVDVVDTPQAKAIIEERIDGHSLGQELDHRGGQLPLHRAYAVFVRIAEAVQAAHDQDLPHFRLNPQSVMISREDNRERVRITGFGVGLALTESGSAASATKDMPVHLAYYLAPDQAHRGMTPSRQSDVYALGVMLYEALTGYVPFGGDDVYSVVRGHLMDPPPPPSGLVADLPWYVEAVVLRAMAKHPEDRLSSPRELALYLRGCASGAVVSSVDAQKAEVPAPPPTPTPVGPNDGVRVRREGPPPSPPAVTPLPLPPAGADEEDDDVPTQVRGIEELDAMLDATVDAVDLLGTARAAPSASLGGAAAEDDDDDHEDTNPSMAIIDDDDLVLVEDSGFIDLSAVGMVSEAAPEPEPEPEPEPVAAPAPIPAAPPVAAAAAAAPAPVAEPVAEAAPEPVELPEGVPNPSYLALLAPRA